MTAEEFLVLVEFESENAPVNGGKMTSRQAKEMSVDLDLSDDEWWQKHGVSKN